MLKSMTFRSTLAAVACALSFSAHAMADSPKSVEIAAGDLRPALLQLSRAFGVELLYQPSQLDHFRTVGVRGNYTPEAAVKLLLKGTPLELRTDPSGAMMVIDPKAPRAAAVSALSEQASPASGSAASSQSRSSLQLGQATPGATAGTTSVAAQNLSPQVVVTKTPTEIQEVLVTAQKREERLQDVPVPVTVVNVQALLESNRLRLQDYYTSVPGLSVVMGGDNGSSPQISIRGLSTGAGGGLTNPTVGIVVDDVPFGGATGLTSGSYVPDFDPSDLANIEVLRGPQGTLYGASTLGGLIKYTTLDPSTVGLSGQLQAGTSTVYNGEKGGYNFRGSLNVPVSDTAAVRASAFTRSDPGYIDNVFSGEKGLFQTRVSGGHVAALWSPSDSFSLKLSALYQQNRSDGAPYIGSSLGTGPVPTGKLQQASIPGGNFYDSKFQVYSATVKAKLGQVDLTSISAYNVNQINDSGDYSWNFGGLSQAFFNVAGAPLQQHMSNKKFTEELRFTGSIGSRVDWLLGGFYDHERNDPSNDTILAADLNTGTIVGELANAASPYTYQEAAGFLNLTFHLTQRFDVQFGARESHITQDYAPVWTGPFITPPFFPAPSPFIPPASSDSANAFTYLFTPAFKFSQDIMVYARLASGYRPGGNNINATAGPIPSYAPDKTQNYEVGAKADLLDHKFILDSSIYYIDWKDIQINTVSPVTQTSIFINGSKAKSEGIELSIESRPTQGLTVSGWVAFNNAVLTEALPIFGPSAVYGPDGARLPYSSRISGDLSINQTFPIGEALGFVGASESYTGARYGDFLQMAQPQYYFPGYATTGLRAGVTYHACKVNFFVNNLTNKLALSGSAFPGVIVGNSFSVIQPRTIGGSVALTF